MVSPAVGTAYIAHQIRSQSGPTRPYHLPPGGNHPGRGTDTMAGVNHPLWTLHLMGPGDRWAYILIVTAMLLVV